MACFPVISPGPSHYNHGKNGLTTFTEYQLLSLYRGIYINMQQQNGKAQNSIYPRVFGWKKELGLIMKSWAWSFTGCTLIHASLNIWLKLFGLEKSLGLPSILQTVMTNDIIKWKIRCRCNHTWNTVPCAEHCHYQWAISRLEGTQKKWKTWLKRWRNCLRKTRRAKWHLARLAWKRGKFIESPHLNFPLTLSTGKVSQGSNVPGAVGFQRESVFGSHFPERLGHQ